MNVSTLTEDFGFNFSVAATHDVSLGCVLVNDQWGGFLPVPIMNWNTVVNIHLFQLMLYRYPGCSKAIAYNEAIIAFCKTYHYNYICMN